MIQLFSDLETYTGWPDLDEPKICCPFLALVFHSVVDKKKKRLGQQG